MNESNPGDLPAPDSATLLSIGDLAEATGISPDTIRVWERRYGRPVPVRLPSGHRRYTGEHIRWMRRVAEALSLGHRPSAVVHMQEGELDQLLYPQAKRIVDTDDVVSLLAAVQRYDLRGINRSLERAHQGLGSRRFMLEWSGPLLDAVGRWWADGKLEIRHEHFLSEILEDFLRTMRHSITGNASGAPLVLTTLVGESHGMGLQMAAIMCALNQVPVILLGRQTPNSEIALTVCETGASAVALSVSLATGGVQTDRVISDLRHRVDRHVSILIGGRGARKARRGPRGVDYVSDPVTFEVWLRKHYERG